MQHTPESRQYLESERSDNWASAAEGLGEEREVPFVFSGHGGEYFRIWIVNIVLTILTLGIYSAWAKVRNKQYFYGNTTLDGSSFSYTARPGQILIGRLIALALLVLYVMAETLSVVAGLAVLLLLMIATPWVITQSLRFNARYSRYRNVSFDFVGTPWQAAQAFLFWPIAGLLTLGLLLPLAVQRQQRFMVGFHRFGDTPFEFHAGPGGYYKILLAAGGIFLVGFLVSIFFIVVLSTIGSTGGAAFGFFLLALVYLAMTPGLAAALANRRYNNTTLARHRFDANWSVLSYVGIVLSNALLTVVTFGLFYPWGKVRVARYKAEHTRVYESGGLDQFVEGQREKAGSVAEGVSDLFDFEVGL